MGFQKKKKIVEKLEGNKYFILFMSHTFFSLKTGKLSYKTGKIFHTSKEIQNQ